LPHQLVPAVLAPCLGGEIVLQPCTALSAAVLVPTMCSRSPLQLELRQYINDLLIKTGGAAAPGFPINSCKLYPVSCAPTLGPAPVMSALPQSYGGVGG
jgi:hypothetical protein